MMRKTLTNMAVTNGALRQARERRNWSQEELATRLGTPAKNVSKWECGVSPTLYYRKRLCEVFNMSAEALGLNEQRSPESQTLIVVPSSRNARPLSFSQQNFLMVPDTDTTPYRLHLYEDRLRQYAETIAWVFLEKDWDLWTLLFQETEEIAEELRIMPQTARRQLSQRIYAFFGLLTGRVVSGRATACRLALEYGIFQIIEEEAERKH